MALRFILVLLVAATGLLLLYHHLGTRESNDLSRASVSGKMSEARAICTERYGTEKDQSKQRSECTSQCLKDTVGDAAQQCVASCRKKTEDFGNCLDRTNDAVSNTLATEPWNDYTQRECCRERP